MGLKPVYLRQANSTIEQADSCNTFQLSPTARAISFSKKRKDADLGTYRHGLYFGNLTNDLETHVVRIVSVVAGILKQLPIGPGTRQRASKA
jgi:hypothetical protein